MAERKDILVYEVPEEIRSALVADASTRDISINDLAVSILFEHYGLKREPTGSRFTDGGGHNLSLRGGVALHKKIDVERAKRGGGTLRGVVLEKLALHYNLEPPSIFRRPKRVKEKA